MTLDSDILIDRRRLKRRLTIWRVLAILALFGVLFVGASRNEETAEYFGLGKDHIARVTVSGFIGDSRARHDLLTKLRKNKNVRAVIVAVDSPGGTTTGGEALYLDLRELAKEKPVAAVFGTAATSAAYLGGIATDYIVARGNTITGSVGVIFQWAEVSDLLSKLGVKVDEIRSGPLKAQPSPFTPADPEARRVAEELVKDSQKWFADLVAERRKGATASLDEIKTGRIYTGRQALGIGLIDAIGDERTAIKWFTDIRNVKANLKVIDWRPKSRTGTSLIQSAIASVAAKLGLTAFDETILAELNAFGERPLAGLFSIWRPSEQN
jgi:protease-4